MLVVEMVRVARTRRMDQLDERDIPPRLEATQGDPMARTRVISCRCGPPHQIVAGDATAAATS